MYNISLGNVLMKVGIYNTKPHIIIYLCDAAVFSYFTLPYLTHSIIFLGEGLEKVARTIRVQLCQYALTYI